MDAHYASGRLDRATGAWKRRSTPRTLRPPHIHSLGSSTSAAICHLEHHVAAHTAQALLVSTCRRPSRSQIDCRPAASSSASGEPAGGRPSNSTGGGSAVLSGLLCPALSAAATGAAPGAAAPFIPIVWNFKGRENDEPPIEQIAVTVDALVEDVGRTPIDGGPAPRGMLKGEEPRQDTTTRLKIE